MWNNIRDKIKNEIEEKLPREFHRKIQGKIYEAAVSDELEYMRMDYWDSFASRMNAAGYRFSERHISVSAAFFSVLVNCGNNLSFRQNSAFRKKSDKRDA